MKERRRQRARTGVLRWTWLHTAAALWTCGGFLLSYAGPWLWDRLWIWSFAVSGAYVLAGAAIVSGCLWAGVRRGFTPVRVTAIGAVLTGALLIGGVGPDAGAAADARWFRARFWRMAPRYERIVKELAAAPGVPQREAAAAWTSWWTPARRTASPFRSRAAPANP